MTQTYHITMDGGKQFLHIRADSASEAMGIALQRNRGWSVTHCETGGVTNIQFPAQTGKIVFDVPRHDPLPLLTDYVTAPEEPTLFPLDDIEPKPSQP